MLNCAQLELRMAQLMAQQEASGFRFDIQAAERVRSELNQKVLDVESRIRSKYKYVPGKTFTPKRTDKKKGFVSGSSMTKLLDFNPTSRQHIAWVLQNHRGARFIKLTDTGKPKVDEATLSEMKEAALQQGNKQLHDECDMFILLLTLQKHLGQLSEGSNSWFNKIEDDGCIHHSCVLSTQTGRNAHSRPNLGQVVSAPWARQLFVPHPGMVLVGADLEGLELRALSHYLYPYDGGQFARVVLEGDIHQQNAERVDCTRTEVKTLTYAFIYGAGDLRLGHSFHPEYSDAQKKALGADLRRKFLNAIPGLEPLIESVKQKVRKDGRIKGLDGRPIFCKSQHAALNYLLQSAGAILSKRWCVVGQQLMDAVGLTYNRDYTRCAYIHDEQQFSVVPQEAQRVANILVEAAPIAGTYYDFKIPITASSAIGENWAKTH